MNFNYTVPCLFGLEGIIADELKYMGATEVVAHDGKVTFSGDANILARVNICMRCGERVLINVGSFDALTFDELFENTKKLPWEDFIGIDDEFPVKGYSLKSTLFSVSDCQAIIKKAVVERLKLKYKIEWFKETKEKKQIQFSILKDNVVLMLDTSGEGLHKRGYRANSNAAPLRETLAAAIVSISRFRNGETLLDPFCGSGTIGIEAALYATKTAPNLNRSFISESWSMINKKVWEEERSRAIDIIRDTDSKIICSDIDSDAVSLTMFNAKKAGVSKLITAETKDVKNLTQSFDKGLIICNPPYGERLMEMKDAEKLYSDMGQVFKQFNNTRYYILTSHENFESQFGKKADKNRKLYNGMIKCYLFQYFKSV